MAERRVVGNILPSWLGKRTPSPNVATTGGARWIDGTAGGSTTDTTYGFYAITGVGNMSYQIVDGAVTLSATNATGRGRVMTAPFEATTTQQNINQYAYRIRPSTSYTFSCNAKGTDLITNTARANVLLFNSSGALVSTKSLSYIPSGTTDYAAYSTTFTSESTASFAVVQCTFTTAGAVMSASFKDFKLDTTTPTTRTTATSRTTATNRVAVRDMGTALQFDGVDDRILIPQTALISFPSNQPMSISAWVKWTSSDGNDDIIRNGSEAIMRLVNGNVVFILNSFTTNDRATSSKKIERGTWANVCGVYDGSAINVYTNGVLTGSATPTGSYATLADTFWRIAEGITGSTQFQGIIDEPRIWNRALTATEIQNLYLNNIVPTDGLVAEYLFDEAAGTTAIDTSGNGNHGTITGATYTTDTPIRPRTSV